MVATPLTGAPQLGQNTALSAIAFPQLWQDMAENYGITLVKRPDYSAIDDYLATRKRERIPIPNCSLF
ncbi:MAG TPA: hypothetical protein VNA15_03570 [Candidatus Angelobacter sp.]|nr:hypothetical protein [Candidatus Angelobacter sp.]